MYLHITSKCNMSCDHCCFDYGKGRKGQHMDWYTFMKSLNYIDEYVTLGGGEPTLHPDFIQIVETLLDCEGTSVYFVTNGSRTRKINKILEMQEYYGDRLHFRVSYDQYHDYSKQSDWLISYARRNNMLNTVQNVISAGRGKMLVSDNPECACEDLTILPNGDVRLCGCLNAPILGNVNYDRIDFNPYWDLDNSRCFNNISPEEQKMFL